ncbi:MAG: DUF2236 domain-containing protein [Deltaproteobacteria bacterium]|nr:MAG: DUF2236 domain-containing protein [Deltaproteobacteria bacterium]
MPGSETRPLPDLSAWREVGDPLADAAVTALMEADNAGAVHRLLATLEENDDSTPPALPPALHRFIETTDELPDWADEQLILEGQRLFSRHGPAMSAALLCGSLPECYAAADGARVLSFTKRLQRGAQRRIYETAQFLVDVMTPGSFAPKARGLRLIQRVRLIHASVRVLTSRDPNWDVRWGVPVNQEDMLGTQLAFGIAVLDALPRFGIDVNDDEIEGYLHTWRVVGFLLGVHPDLLPVDLPHARALRQAIRTRHMRPSKHGTQLAMSLVDTLSVLVPGTTFDPIVPALVHHVAGSEVAELLEVPKGHVPAVLRGTRVLIEAADELGDASPAMATVASIFSRALIQGLLWVNREGKRAEFRIPTEITQLWGVHV